MTDDDLPDLLAWRVPPPPSLDARLLVMRALSPATTPARRPRLRWLVASIVLVNAVIAALLVIVLARPPASRPAVVVQPAGGGSMDARVHELLARLADEQAALEKRLAELEQLRALVLELSDKVDRCEQDRTVAKPPAPTPAPAPDPRAVVAPATTSCDEVSCVLTNYEGACCDKFKQPAVAPPAPGIPDALDSAAISNGVAPVKGEVAACATKTLAKGTVKVHVRVRANGLVSNVDIAQTPDPALGACVAAAMQGAVFQRTKAGGMFTYPFVF